MTNSTVYHYIGHALWIKEGVAEWRRCSDAEKLAWAMSRVDAYNLLTEILG